MLVTKLSQHLLILNKPWMQKHGLIIDMSCNKITFWPDYCQHLTVETKLWGIILAPFRSEPMRGQEEILAQKLGRIMSFSSLKEKLKKVPAGRDISYTNFGVTEPKKKEIPGIKILKKEPDAKTKWKETVLIKNSPKLLLHMLPNARGYRCVSKEAEEPPAKYIMSQRQARALSATSPLTLLKIS